MNEASCHDTYNNIVLGMTRWSGNHRTIGQQYQAPTSLEGKMVHSDDDIFFYFNRFITWPGVFARKSDVWIVGK